MRVLIVEDESIIALELERIVADAGYRPVGPVATVEQALAHGWIPSASSTSPSEVTASSSLQARKQQCHIAVTVLVRQGEGAGGYRALANASTSTVTLKAVNPHRHTSTSFRSTPARQCCLVGSRLRLIGVVRIATSKS